LPNLRDDLSELSADFGPTFKQLFCATAQRLANLLHEPLERLGVLFEDPLDTGAIYVSSQARGVLGGITSRPYKSNYVENSIASQVLARGKYLILHRQLSPSETIKFSTLSYRFASVDQVSGLLARNLQVDDDMLLTRLERMKLSASASRLPPPGAHLACFMVRPSISKGFDVLVPAKTQNQLPFSTIQSQDLSLGQIDQLRKFDGCTVHEMIRTLANQSGDLDLSGEFRWQLYNSCIKLVDIVGDPHITMDAKFSARVFEIPCQSNIDANIPGSCTLLTVRCLRDIHASSTKQELTYVPLSFFKGQQQAESDSSDKTFAQRLKMEFGHLLRDPSSSYPTVASVGGSKRASSVKSREHVSDSRRSLFAIAGARLHSSRKSDEITMVDEAKNATDGSDVEITAIATGQVGTSFGKTAWETEGDITELISAGTSQNSWVSELFALFQLGHGGWSSGQSGWKWDVNVETSFEVSTKDLVVADPDTVKAQIFM
jgi:hypothetical protein